MKTRQLTFREMGGPGYSKAQRLAFNLRSLSYDAEQGCISSPAGSWADTLYLMTNAPLPIVRKEAAKEGLTINA